MAMSESHQPMRGRMRGLLLPLMVIFGMLGMFVIGWVKSREPLSQTALPASPPVPSATPLPR